MKIRYRDSRGRFISKEKARHIRKGISSELYEVRVTRTPFGLVSRAVQVKKPVSGYWTSPKKLKRRVLPQITIRTPKPLPDFEEEDIPDNILDEWEAIADEFAEIDEELDRLEELLSEEDEFYESLKLDRLEELLSEEDESKQSHGKNRRG